MRRSRQEPTCQRPSPSRGWEAHPRGGLTGTPGDPPPPRSPLPSAPTQSGPRAWPCILDRLGLVSPHLAGQGPPSSTASSPSEEPSHRRALTDFLERAFGRWGRVGDSGSLQGCRLSGPGTRSWAGVPLVLTILLSGTQLCSRYGWPRSDHRLNARPAGLRGRPEPQGRAGETGCPKEEDTPAGSTGRARPRSGPSGLGSLGSV